MHTKKNVLVKKNVYKKVKYGYANTKLCLKERQSSGNIPTLRKGEK